MRPLVGDETRGSSESHADVKPSHSEAVLHPAQLKRTSAALENLLYQLANAARINRTHVLLRERADSIVPRGQPDDQLRVAEDRDVGVMRGEDELPSPLLLSHFRHYAFGDEPVVEVVFGLVDDERRLGLKQQQ